MSTLDWCEYPPPPGFHSTEEQTIFIVQHRTWAPEPAGNQKRSEKYSPWREVNSASNLLPTHILIELYRIPSCHTPGFNVTSEQQTRRQTRFPLLIQYSKSWPSLITAHSFKVQSSCLLSSVVVKVQCSVSINKEPIGPMKNLKQKYNIQYI